MSETPRDQRALWREVSRTFEEFGEAVRVHLSPDAARTPSDPTMPQPPGHPGMGSDQAGSVDPADTEPAPWADPAGPGRAERFDDPWAAATDSPPRAAPGSTTPGTDGTPTAATGSAATGPETTAADPTSGTDATAAGSAGAGATGSAPAGADATGEAGAAASSGAGATTGGAEAGAAGTSTAPDGAGGTETGSGASAGTAGGAGTTGNGDGAAGGPGAGGARERWWEGSGTTGGGRFAGPADWDSARESVRDLGGSVRRIATQAGDAARDPHVRDSAQRAARSLGDAIVTTVEDLAAELRERMHTTRWSDPSGPPEPPPVAPIEDRRDDKP